MNGGFAIAVTDWGATFWGAMVTPILAAILAAGVVVFGYLFDRRNRRRDELRDLCSEALRAVADYEELPYLIRRRSDRSPMTPAELVARASDVQTKLDYFATRLRLEREDLGGAFADLVNAIRKESGAHMSEAWNQSRIEKDAEVPLGSPYGRTSGDRARARCLSVMQRVLGG